MKAQPCAKPPWPVDKSLGTKRQIWILFIQSHSTTGAKIKCLPWLDRLLARSNPTRQTQLGQSLDFIHHSFQASFFLENRVDNGCLGIRLESTEFLDYLKGRKLKRVPSLSALPLDMVAYTQTGGHHGDVCPPAMFDRAPPLLKSHSHPRWVVSLQSPPKGSLERKTTTST